jgi:hypothetical protein
MPSVTFFRVLSISCWSFLFAPILQGSSDRQSRVFLLHLIRGNTSRVPLPSQKDCCDCSEGKEGDINPTALCELGACMCSPTYQSDVNSRSVLDQHPRSTAPVGWLISHLS